jgi:hypothetical protein
MHNRERRFSREIALVLFLESAMVCFKIYLA